MLTPFAFHTTMPLRPATLPLCVLGTVLLRAGVGAARRGARLGAVDDDARAAHPPQVQVRLGDVDATEVAVLEALRRVREVSGLVIIAGGNQNPVAGLRSVHRRLDALVLAGLTVVGPDQQHVARRTAARRTAARGTAAGIAAGGAAGRRGPAGGDHGGGGDHTRTGYQATAAAGQVTNHVDYPREADELTSSCHGVWTQRRDANRPWG